MAASEIVIGSFALREVNLAQQIGDVVTIVGQESYPPSSRAAVRAAHDAVTAMPGLILPVVFTDKASLTGFYEIQEGRSDLDPWNRGAVLTASWQLTMERVGGPRDVEVESYVPRIGRQTDLAAVPTFWHAPASGVTDYFTGSEVPAYTVIREGRDGLVAVHTGLPAGTDPRWSVTPDKYMNAAAVLRLDGRRRIGTVTPPDVASWEVENGLVRLTSSAGRIVVECWDPETEDWTSSTGWGFIATTELVAAPELTVIRNDPEEVTVRLTYPQSLGRVTVDLGLRRGSRFVTGTMKRHSAATLGVLDDSSGSVQIITGGFRAASADASGNRAVAGSPQAVTVGADGRLSLATTTRFDFFVGHEVGDPAPEGDTFSDLLSQYLGSTGEMTNVVLR